MPKLPKPFQAPSINLATHGKAWLDVLPTELEVGDHVMNYGIIAEISNDNGGLRFIFAGTVLPIQFDLSSPLRAFTKVK